ncbi:MAG: glycerophosphodiester phosphodiesterase family protein [Pseudomonadota bacterium]
MKYVKILLLVVALVYLNNASWLRSVPDAELRFLAHRGVHQNFSKAGITGQSCTASRIEAPSHQYLENTLDSIDQAFALGADIVEVDIHPTADGRFVVFHDWTIDCRTEGKGVTREQTLSYLKSLDIAYGYTADEGKSYPLRGTGIGKMPSLAEVLDRFPEQKFLINIKSNDPVEADLINAFLAQRPGENLGRLSFYGGQLPTSRLRQLNPSLSGFTNASVKRCAIRYLLLAWTGYLPESCRDTTVAIPIDYAPYFWGWPRLFVSRMHNANSQVILLDMSHGHTDGIDDPDLVHSLAPDFRGIIWTDKIEQLESKND